VFSAANGLLMFRASVEAFSPGLACLFYRFADPGLRQRFLTLRRLLRARSEVEKIVHWMPEIQFAAEIAFADCTPCTPLARIDLL
jgi:hypothetical protein